jgi:hypothetical protein
MKEQLKELIKAQIKHSFMPEYQAQATDEDALGLMLCRYFEYDGLAILKATYSALEDANFHTENRLIERMIKRLEKFEAA